MLADKVDILAHSIRDVPLSKQTIRAIKLQKVYYIPALFEMVSSEAFRSKVQNDPMTAAHRAALAMAMKNLKRTHAAHVMVAFGTDSGATPLRVQGFDEHRELALMVEAGFKPLEAIHSAT